MRQLVDLFKSLNELADSDDEGDCGTVGQYPLFNASEDAAFLNRAILAEGVEPIHIVERLLKVNNEQRQQIQAAYQEAFGQCLSADLEAKLDGDLKDLTLALLKTPAQYDAHELRKAMKGWGTDESVLIEILVSRTNNEVRQIIEAYKQEFDRDLLEDIDDENRGHFQDALLNILKGKRSEDTEVIDDLAESDAEALYHAGENKTGTNDTLFVNMFTTRSNPQLRRIFKKYGKHSDSEIAHALDCELSGDIEDCLVAIAECAMSKPAFFADKLHDAMEGRGTRTETLIRVLVSRAEIDLKKVEKQYKKMFEKSLQQDILAESNGDLETAMLILCGKDD